MPYGEGGGNGAIGSVICSRHGCVDQLNTNIKCALCFQFSVVLAKGNPTADKNFVMEMDLFWGNCVPFVVFTHLSRRNYRIGVLLLSEK